jgi:hypothetical protein
MRDSHRQDVRRNRSPWLIGVLAGVGVAAFVAIHVPEGVFFSGDGGLKFALVKQHAAGFLGSDVLPPEEEWARGLWDEGLAPFGPPFAYRVDGRLRAAFPPLFPLLSTPPYLAFGFFGLYLLPIAGVAASAAGAMILARRLGASRRMELLAAAACVASPLTIYGAMFWEHAPAAAGGVLAVLAAALRPESALFAIALTAALGLGGGPARRRAAFAGGALGAGLVMIALLNWIQSGAVTGLHGRQSGLDPVRGLAQAKALAPLFLLGYPLCVFALAGLRRPAHSHDALRSLAGAALVTLLAVPFLVPNLGGYQLGPRYLVFLVPVFAGLAGGVLSRTFRDGQKAIAWALAGAFCICLVWSTHLDLLLFGGALEHHYAVRAAAFEFLRARPERVVVFTHQWNAQDFGALLSERVFLRLQRFDGQLRPDEEKEAVGASQLARLADVLASRGIDGFLLVALAEQEVPSRHALRSGTIEFTPLSAGFPYKFYAARIRSH